MYIINARNAHQALAKGLALLEDVGVSRASRNGAVRVAPAPVSTVYSHPRERLTFWPQRDVNVAFLVIEALWMLAGRNDVQPLVRYISDFGRYSDDSVTLHGAYGYRWRKHFGVDQLKVVIERLKRDPDDRRSVVQMWDTRFDLDALSKDVPCNDMLTFQRDEHGRLHMVVFCRSNDIVWGAYFANAFHFGLLLEYVASGIGCDVGTYTQVSVNWHAYEETLKLVDGISDAALARIFAVPAKIPDPYVDGEVSVAAVQDINRFDALSARLMVAAQAGFNLESGVTEDDGWLYPAEIVLRSHQVYRTRKGDPSRFQAARAALASADRQNDMVEAMSRWIEAREIKANGGSK